MSKSSSDGEKAVTVIQLRQAARRMANKALETLAEIMQGEGQVAVRLSAAREILDRGYGRPKLSDADATPKPGGGMTVIVRKFTDPPAEEPTQGEEHS
ncbi:hypothetical protein ACO2Q0_03160 [Phenylobacterium sp. VNQ135]|uniref:hypothetical protein n=1 Tax=Phenylobacterium sp. VNQ135 TaxID=3400922 RepID=UPI003C0A50A5